MQQVWQLNITIKYYLFLHGYNDNTLELCFGNKDKHKKIIGQFIQNKAAVANDGIRGLYRLVESGKVSPETIQDYTYLVYNNRLEILYGYKDTQNTSTKVEYAKVKEGYKDIIQSANKFYDIVLVDLDKGLQEPMIKEILNISDVIVCNVEQKLDMINDFKKLKEESDITTKNNLVLNIGRFNEESKYTIKNISRYLKIKKDITFIPYNTLYFEAASEEDVSELFLRIRKLSETDKNAIFKKQVDNAVEKIIYKMQEVQMKIR